MDQKTKRFLFNVGVTGLMVGATFSLISNIATIANLYRSN